MQILETVNNLVYKTYYLSRYSIPDLLNSVQVSSQYKYFQFDHIYYIAKRAFICYY